MPANVETMFSANGITPWHREGHVLPADVGFEQGWKLSGHDFKIEKWQVHTPEGEPVPNCYGTRRTDTGVILTSCRRIVSEEWQPVQNDEVWRIWEPFVKSGEIKLETAGVLEGGRKVWILGCPAHNSAEVLPGDEVKSYVLFANGHDGSLSVTLGHTNVRVVCCNTLEAAQRQGFMWKGRHVGEIAEKIADVAGIIAKLGEAFRGDIEVYQQLAATPVTDVADIVNYTAAVFGKAEQKAQQEDRVSKRLDAMLENFESGTGQDIPGVRGTAWGLYNALTEYVSHQMRSDLDSIAFGNRAKLLRRGLDVARVMARGIPLEDVLNGDVLDRVQEVQWSKSLTG